MEPMYQKLNDLEAWYTRECARYTDTGERSLYGLPEGELIRMRYDTTLKTLF